MCRLSSRLARISIALLILLIGFDATTYGGQCDPRLAALLGERVEFPIFPENKLQYLIYFCQKPESLSKKVDYRKLEGKHGSIVDVFPSEYGLTCWARIEVEDLEKAVYLEAHVGHFDDIFFSAESDSAKRLVGKIFHWRNRDGDNRDRGLVDSNDPLDGGQPRSVQVMPGEAMRLIEAAGPRGWMSDCTLLFQREDSSRVIWHGPIRDLNVSGEYPETFFDNWLPEEQAKALFANWSANDWRAVQRNEAKIGMTRAMIHFSLGDPGEVKTTTTADGVSIEWYYFTDYKKLQLRRLVVFVNDVAVAIRDE